MSEEKKMILEMLKNGDISVEEAEKLLAAVPDSKQNSDIALTSKSSGIRPRKIKITVTDNDTSKNKVDIRIPFSLLKAGLKIGKASMALGAKYTGERESQQILELLREVDIDEILDSIDDGDITLPYTMIDMDNHEDGKNEHIEIVLE
jgi:hypothetical protein